MRRIPSGKKAFAIVAAILIMVIVSVIGQTALSIISAGAMGSVNYLQSQQAFFLAESGVEEALLEINKGDGIWTDWSGSNPKTIQLTLAGYGDYDISVADPNSNQPHITATGYAPNRNTSLRSVRVIEVLVRKTNLLGLYGLFAGGSSGMTSKAVSMSGSSYIDSYNASLGDYNIALSEEEVNRAFNGDVATNADMKATGSSHIYGDVATGPSGTFEDISRVSGSITHEMSTPLNPVVVPTYLTGLTTGGNINSTYSIAPGNYKFSRIAITGSETVTITGPANIYLTNSNSMSTTGSAKVVISEESTGPVVIYADGDISSTGSSGVANNTVLPVNFQLYGSNSSSQSIDLSGSTAFYGFIYAPKGALDLSGSSGFYGSFVGDDIEVTGSAAIHRDESLADFNAPPFVPTKSNRTGWTEIY